jgi:glycogen synthase
MYSPAFLPLIGGLEIHTATLAGELTIQGHEVAVVTQTPGDGPDSFPFQVVRTPSPRALLRWARWCDVYFQQNVSLRGLWPLLLVHRPWVVSHQSWYCQSDGRIAWQDRLKRSLLRRAAASIAASQALAADLDASSIVIANAYREDLFRLLPGVERDGELLFVGRLVSDKGVDILLDTLALLAGEGLTPRLSVVGDGPERTRLEAQAQRLGIADRVDFLGTRTGEELVRLLNRHRILAVPSRYNEPFGIVALEGIACGCLVVGSAGGGLQEAIGPCGLTFRNGDAADLAWVLAPLLRNPAAGRQLLARAADHLAAHSSQEIGRAYGRILEKVVRERPPAPGLRILMHSPAFLPRIGGLEINTANIAQQLASHGHDVMVVTRTPGDEPDRFPFRVARNPSPAKLLRWIRWCDVFFQQNVSLRGLWPLLLFRRPWVVSHHSWYRGPDGRRTWRDRLKRQVLRRATASIAVSQAMADDLETPSTVILNAYRDQLFRILPDVERTRDLAFLGRLVSDKGVDVLIDALGRLTAQGLRPGLTVIGEGPEAPRIIEHARRLGIADQIEMAGMRTGEELVRLLNEHRILVVPSMYNEPFGTVALEGIACGCLVVGSSGGGLKEAIGPCGMTFPNGDAAALADALARLLTDSAAGFDLLRHAPEHLAHHTCAAVGLAYERVLLRAAGRRETTS